VIARADSLEVTVTGPTKGCVRGRACREVPIATNEITPVRRSSSARRTPPADPHQSDRVPTASGISDDLEVSSRGAPEAAAINGEYGVSDINGDVELTTDRAEECGSQRGGNARLTLAVATDSRHRCKGPERFAGRCRDVNGNIKGR